MGRRRFVRRTATDWYAGMAPAIIGIALILPPVLGAEGYLTLNRVVWVLVVSVTLLPAAAWLLGRLLWWQMERRYGEGE